LKTLGSGFKNKFQKKIPTKKVITMLSRKKKFGFFEALAVLQ